MEVPETCLVPETCPVTGKVLYTNKVRALLAVVKIEEVGPKEEGGPIPKRAYLCEFCGGYHLTSQEERSAQVHQPASILHHRR